MRASILFAVCAFALPVAAQAGWEDTGWGMSAADIRAKHPDAVPNTDRDNVDGALISSVMIPQYEAAGCSYRVNFWFQRGGGLAKVALYTPEGNRKQATACYKSMRQALTQVYGQPGSEKTSKPTRYTQQLDVGWTDGDTAIGLHVADVPRAKKAFVSVSYAPLR